MIRKYAVEIYAALAVALFFAGVTVQGVSLTFDRNVLAGWGIIGFSIIFAGAAVQAREVRRG